MVPKHRCCAQGCGLKFDTADLLKLHVEASHLANQYPNPNQNQIQNPIHDQNHNQNHDQNQNNPQPSICIDCGMRCDTEAQLRRHRRKHEQADLFACYRTGCNKSFWRQDMLAQHMEKAHGDDLRAALQLWEGMGGGQGLQGGGGLQGNYILPGVDGLHGVDGMWQFMY